MKNSDYLLIVVAIIALGGIAYGFGLLNFLWPDQDPATNPFITPGQEKIPLYEINAHGRAQFDALPGGSIFGGGWKLLDPVTVTQSFQGYLSLMPLSAWLPTGEVTVTGSIVSSKGLGPKQCSQANLGTFDTISGGVKEYDVKCTGLPAGDYTLTLKLYEGGVADANLKVTKQVSVKVV